MNAEAILAKIGEDAKETAGKILREAEAKAEAMKAASRAKLEQSRLATLAKAEEDSAELEQRMLRMEELDARKALLSRKRALIAEAFTLAGEHLSGLSAEEKRAFFLQQVTQNAAGNETLAVGDRNADWVNVGWLESVNQALTAAGKPGKLTQTNAPYQACEGVVLLANGAEIHCTFEALLEEARIEMEQPVAELLFEEA